MGLEKLVVLRNRMMRPKGLDKQRQFFEQMIEEAKDRGFRMPGESEYVMWKHKKKQKEFRDRTPEKFDRDVSRKAKRMKRSAERVNKKIDELYKPSDKSAPKKNPTPFQEFATDEAVWRDKVAARDSARKYIDEIYKRLKDNPELRTPVNVKLVEAALGKFKTNDIWSMIMDPETVNTINSNPQARDALLEMIQKQPQKGQMLERFNRETNNSILPTKMEDRSINDFNDYLERFEAQNKIDRPLNAGPKLDVSAVGGMIDETPPEISHMQAASPTSFANDDRAELLAYLIRNNKTALTDADEFLNSRATNNDYLDAFDFKTGKHVPNKRYEGIIRDEERQALAKQEAINREGRREELPRIRQSKALERRWIGSEEDLRNEQNKILHPRQMRGDEDVIDAMLDNLTNKAEKITKDILDKEKEIKIMFNKGRLGEEGALTELKDKQQLVEEYKKKRDLLYEQISNIEDSVKSEVPTVTKTNRIRDKNGNVVSGKSYKIDNTPYKSEESVMSQFDEPSRMDADQLPERFDTDYLDRISKNKGHEWEPKSKQKKDDAIKAAVSLKTINKEKLKTGVPLQYIDRKGNVTESTEPLGIGLRKSVSANLGRPIENAGTKDYGSTLNRLREELLRNPMKSGEEKRYKDFVIKRQGNKYNVSRFSQNGKLVGAKSFDKGRDVLEYLDKVSITGGSMSRYMNPKSPEALISAMRERGGTLKSGAKRAERLEGLSNRIPPQKTKNVVERERAGGGMTASEKAKLRQRFDAIQPISGKKKKLIDESLIEEITKTEKGKKVPWFRIRGSMVNGKYKEFRRLKDALAYLQRQIDE